MGSKDICAFSMAITHAARRGVGGIGVKRVKRVKRGL
jgi:hypothetical protein